MNNFVGFTLSGSFIAAIFVFITFLDRSLWLSTVLHGKAKVIHGFIFMLTVQASTIACWIACIAVVSLLTCLSETVRNDEDTWVQLLAVALGWGAVLYFFFQAMAKVCSWGASASRNRSNSSNSSSNEKLAIIVNLPHYEAIIDSPPTSSTFMRNSFSTSLESAAVTDPRVRFVAATTLSTALEELVVFAVLLLGKIFTIQELLVGCFFGSLSILVCVHSGLDSCKGLLDALHAIPMFVIVGIIAGVETVEYVHRNQT